MAIKHSNATTASFAFFMKACIAPFLAMILLNERILYNIYIGIALIYQFYNKVKIKTDKQILKEWAVIDKFEVKSEGDYAQI